ncbi:transposase [Sorangium sp. So ce1036]|uniref:transposase n=1 Tax=Sorangium sp. So ce1036 TaxID=3133328 RepID=UPI003F012A62
MSIEGYDDEGRERLVRYCARPCFALERLSILRDGRVAYQVKYPRRKGTHRVMTPIVFFARLAALVPPPRHPLVRYHGVLAPHAKQRSLVVPKATGKARKGEQRAGADSAGSDDKMLDSCRRGSRSGILIGCWMGSFWRRRLASNGRSFCGGLTQ